MFSGNFWDFFIRCINRYVEMIMVLSFDNYGYYLLGVNLFF